jgi:hypothetical protein
VTTVSSTYPFVIKPLQVRLLLPRLEFGISLVMKFQSIIVLAFIGMKKCRSVSLSIIDVFDKENNESTKS